MLKPPPARRATNADPEGLNDQIAVRVVRVSEALTRIATRTIEARWGLRNTDLRLLSVLDGEAAVTIAEISRRTHVDKAWISRSVVTLEQRGLVARQADPTDSRVSRIQLTARGRDILEEVRPYALRREAELLAGIDGGALKAMLDRLEANATELLDRAVRAAPSGAPVARKGRGRAD